MSTSELAPRSYHTFHCSNPILDILYAVALVNTAFMFLFGIRFWQIASATSSYSRESLLLLLLLL